MRRTLARLATLLSLAALSGFLVSSRVSLRRTEEARDLLQRKYKLLEGDSERMRTALSKIGAARLEAESREWREKIEKDVEAIRGLKFLHPVSYSVVTRQEIKDVVAGKLAEVYSAEDFRHMADALARLGLLPPGYDLRGKYIALLGEQIAAFYDQHTHQLFMFADAKLDIAQNRVVLAHELTHALQDQHFGLKTLPLEIKDNDDRASAAAALVEGEATMVMSSYMLQNLSLKSLKEDVGSAFAQNAEQLASAPRIMREALLFPYLRGQEFCGYVSEGGGMEGLSACYARLPGSSAEILHPERYERQWHPAEIAWPRPMLNDRAPTLTNVVGELSLRVQLDGGIESKDTGSRLTHEHLSAQWKGDRYWYFAPEDTLVWKTEWATIEAAAEFEKAQTALAQARAKAPGREDGAFALVRRGTTVTMIDAQTKAAAEQLQSSLPN